jgi:hypothetical protein
VLGADLVRDRMDKLEEIRGFCSQQSPANAGG